MTGGTLRKLDVAESRTDGASAGCTPFKFRVFVRTETQAWTAEHG